jgi:hypothetical protein
MSSLHVASHQAPGRSGILFRLLSWLFPADPSQASSPLRTWLLRLAAIAGIATLSFQVYLLMPPRFYGKDFKQEYMLARAVLDRTNPYVSEKELAARYIPESVDYALPSLHPPAVALLAAPLGFLPYRAAATAWLLFEMSLLLLLAVMVTSTGRSLRFGRGAIAAWCILLLWRPVIEELAFGQLGLPLAALLGGSWFAMQSGRRRLAGVFLGAAVAVKLFPVVIALYLLVKGRWSTVVSAGITASLLTVLAGAAVGVDGVVSYVGELQAGTPFLPAEHNCSIYGAVLRIFTGGLLIQPLIDAPAVGKVLAPLAMVVVWAVTAWVIWRSDDPRLELAAGIASLVVAGPLSWRHYQVLLIWPLFTLGQRLRENGWPRADTLLLLFGVLIPSIPGRAAMMLPIEAAWSMLMGPAVPTALGQTAPAITMLPYELEALGPAFVLWVILRQMRRSRAEEATSPAMMEPAGTR